MARYLTKLTNRWKVLPPTAALEQSPTTEALYMRVVVVAGATTPIGQAVSLKLAQNGARVAGLSSDAAKLDQIAKEAALSGGMWGVQRKYARACACAGRALLWVGRALLKAALLIGIFLPLLADLTDLPHVRSCIDKAESELAAPVWGLVNCSSKMYCEQVRGLSLRV